MSKYPPFWGQGWKAMRDYYEEGDIQKEIEHSEKYEIFFSLNPKEDGKCKCGGRMVLRQNKKNGEYFYGCSNYPECKNTCDILRESDYLFGIKNLEGMKKNGVLILDSDKRYQAYLLEKKQQKENRKNSKAKKVQKIIKSAAADLEKTL